MTKLKKNTSGIIRKGVWLLLLMDNTDTPNSLKTCTGRKGGGGGRGGLKPAACVSRSKASSAANKYKEGLLAQHRKQATLAMVVLATVVMAT